MQTNVLSYLERCASVFADREAYLDDKTVYTFARLRSCSLALAAEIARAAGRVNRPVAVLIRRTAPELMGCMAALYAGCFYAPLDAAMPRERLAGILSSLEPAAILCGPRDLETARALAGDIPVFDLTADYPARPDAGLWRRVLDTDPAYMIYTSGSTGVPKGILIAHRSVIDFTDWYAAVTGADENDRLGNQAPFFFDLSVKDVYLTLKTGAATYILPKKCFSFPVLLIRALNEQRITTLSWATAAFHLTANSGVLEKYRPEYLKRVLLGGEALQAKQLNIWRRALPDVRYVNLYGPTETTVDCTYYPIDRAFSEEEAIPIGWACENMEVFLLNEEDRLCAVGEPGEICARGTGIAIGYFKEPEKTAACFTQNPLNPCYPDRIYRTGDIAVLGEDGLFRFLSRKDSQVKHNGYRIELGEIETALNAIAGVEEAVCLYDAKADRIVALYAGAVETAELVKALLQRLPKYMTPEDYVPLQRLPHLPNGKIDRVSLKRDHLT